MALQRMGRPIGSKDSRPRKPKFSVRTPSPEIASDSLTPFTAVRNCEVRQHFYAPQRNLEVHARPTISDQVPHDSVAPRRLFSLLQPQSSSAAACLLRMSEKRRGRPSTISCTHGRNADPASPQPVVLRRAPPTIFFANHLAGTVLPLCICAAAGGFAGHIWTRCQTLVAFH